MDGATFTLDETVKARITIEPDGPSGLVFALPGDPEQRRAFALLWNGSEWKLSETVGDAPPVQEIAVGKTRTTALIVEISDAGRTIKITSTDEVKGSMTSKSTEAPTGPMGIYVQLEPGAKLAVTDLTITQRLEVQAELFAAVAETCLAVPACKNITLFGFSDKHGWDELGPAVCKTEGTAELCSEPLIFTREYEPKPAYRSLRTALGGYRAGKASPFRGD